MVPSWRCNRALHLSMILTMTLLNEALCFGLRRGRLGNVCTKMASPASFARCQQMGILEPRSSLKNRAWQDNPRKHIMRRLSATAAGSNSTSAPQPPQQRRRGAAPDSKPVELYIPMAEDMEDFGAILSSTLLLSDSPDEEIYDRRGDSSPRGSIIFLDGDLGAGKTALARGFIRAATGDPDLRVTSPTYLLSNTYRVVLERDRIGADGEDDSKGVSDSLEIRHMDLYRLSGRPEDLRPLDLDHVFKNCISLIEWPSRLGEYVPDERLEVHITIPNKPDGNSNRVMEEYGEGEDKLRYMSLRPFGSRWRRWIEKLLHDGYIDDLLEPDE